MTRRIAAVHALVATILLVGCDSHPSAPSAIAQSGASATEADPAHPLTGTFALTLSLGATCSAVPSADRTRAYRATIAYRSDLNAYIVTLTGSFLSGAICSAGSGRFAGMGCDQFFAFEDIGNWWAELVNNNDEAHGAHLVERLPSGTWMEVTGIAAGPLTTTSSMEATGKADVWYCATPSAYPFPCAAVMSCQNVDLGLKLTRTIR